MQQNEFTTEMKYAGFWVRVIAAIVDEIIVLIGAGIIGFFIGVALAASMAITSTSTQSEIPTVIGGLALVNISISVSRWLYFTVSESSSWQATLGKKMFGLKVTDVEGNKIGFGKANGRYWSKIISAIILLIGYIMVAFTKKKQGLHDIIAGTLVIKKA